MNSTRTVGVAQCNQSSVVMLVRNTNTNVYWPNNLITLSKQTRDLAFRLRLAIDLRLVVYQDCQGLVDLTNLSPTQRGTS
jgi:HEAT repeat protein